MVDAENGSPWMADREGLIDYGYESECRSDCDGYEIHSLAARKPYPDLLERIDTGYGGSYTLAYTPSSAYPNALLPYVVQTLSAITADDGNGTTGTTRFSYSGGRHSLTKREFRGFEWVTTTHPDGASVQTRFAQGDADKGLVLKTLTRSAAGELYDHTVNAYTLGAPYASTSAPQLEQRIYEGAASPRTRLAYDPYGNVTKTSHEGDVAVVGDERFDYATYVYDEGNWLLARPERTWTQEATDTAKVASTRYIYYPGLSLVWKKVPWLDGVHDPVITYTYDAYGNLESVRDPNGFLTDYGYDGTSTYVTSTRRRPGGALVLERSSTVSQSFGVPLSQTDENGQITRYELDAFGRRTKVTGPLDALSTDGSASTFYNGFGTVGQQRVVTYTTEEHGTGRSLWRMVYFDGLGREIKVRREAPEGKVVVVTTAYTPRGLVARKSLPAFEGDPAEAVQTLYNGKGRLIQVTQPDGTVSTVSYKRDYPAAVDANGHRRIAYPDALGRLAKVNEYKGEAGAYTLYATTTYAYDTLGNLREVIDGANKVTRIFYDPLSRKREMSDPNMGTWSYDYDGNGNLILQTDAKQQTLTFTYDGLNRMAGTFYPDGTALRTLYDAYADGTANNVRGRLSTVTDASGETRFTYDALGRVGRTIRTLEGQTYTVNIIPPRFWTAC